ncbi:thioredoxin-like domain protein (macronuclear) [Tetrahymena thermophila SB210]|uniref:Thioredoxin-like domain protein n=1 Tax=Tetrahymena thermophila (strain SB210) TaxID=312017 RepID=Q23AY2_TETTS|nr:thioredoxin-like domain protein [Tetrahymena thermophila SB210]EAR93702.2 thioredoxin-like domain protein [Tetrahymena thermophila SB210]|eukprot:XP_001013947.2 thioredoxin-like domain protein [Tetrahymena thermophila SB210]
MKFLSFVLLICALTVLAKGEEEFDKSQSLEVKVDTYDDFLKLTKTNDYFLFFYSPSCPYCQRVYSELKNLTTLIQDYNKNVAIPQKKAELKLAHIDGIENKALIDTLSVEFYPSFIYFINGFIRFYPLSSERNANKFFEFYTQDYIKHLPEIPGLKRDILTKKALWSFYNKLANKYEQLPELFWAAGAILGLGLLLHPFLYRQFPSEKKQ